MYIHVFLYAKKHMPELKPAATRVKPLMEPSDRALMEPFGARAKDSCRFFFWVLVKGFM